MLSGGVIYTKSGGNTYTAYLQITLVSSEISRPVAEERLWKKSHMDRASGEDRCSVTFCFSTAAMWS